MVARIVLLLGSLVPAGSLYAQAVWIEDRENNVETIRLTVSPADEPVPAFRHRLMVRAGDRVPGNRVSHYTRAFAEHGVEWTWKRLEEKYGEEELYSWYGTDIPLQELPAEAREAAQALEETSRSYLAPGSIRIDCDWGYDPMDLKGVEVIEWLLPEVQSMRMLSRGLGFETRIALLDQDYEKAIDRIRINLQLGRDVGEQRFLVSGLVGIACHGIAANGVTELIAQPDSPNLYWALSALPSPPVSVREATRLELSMAGRMFPEMVPPRELSKEERDPLVKPRLTAAEWNARWSRLATPSTWISLTGLLSAFPSTQRGDPFGQLSDQVTPVGWGMLGYTHAKERLVAWGRDPTEVEQMSVGEALLRYNYGAYRRIADELEKPLYLPFSEARKLSDPWDRGPLSAHPDRELLPIASLLLPATQAARTAEMRVTRQFAALRLIEALRMHAAQNEGKLPESLDAVTCVHLPMNPATDKPFEYALDGSVAKLTLPEADGCSPGRTYVYEIRIRGR